MTLAADIRGAVAGAVSELLASLGVEAKLRRPATATESADGTNPATYRGVAGVTDPIRVVVAETRVGVLQRTWGAEAQVECELLAVDAVPIARGDVLKMPDGILSGPLAGRWVVVVDFATVPMGGVHRIAVISTQSLDALDEGP